MGSQVRKWLMNPISTLKLANIKSDQKILEVGCGTGFFTIPAARLVGNQGCIIAPDASSGFLEVVAKKTHEAELKNVQILQRDALDTGLEPESIDKVLLFGVVPFPLLPLDKLLPEMQRVLKPEATLSLWIFPPLIHNWVPKAIEKSGLFKKTSNKNSIHNYVRLQSKT